MEEMLQPILTYRGLPELFGSFLAFHVKFDKDIEDTRFIYAWHFTHLLT